MGMFQSDLVSLVKACIKLTSTHYPQRSHKMIIINVPKWFDALYAIVRPLLNEAQRAKINIFRGDSVLTGMRETIDDDNIPKELGGSCPVEMGQMPEEKALLEYVMKGLVESETPLTTDATLLGTDGK